MSYWEYVQTQNMNNISSHIPGVLEDFSRESANISVAPGSISGELSHSNSDSVLRAASILDLYYTPLICFLGGLGNCLSVIVFCKNGSHRQFSSSFYLSALAISDTGFLLTLFSVWLDRMGNGIILSTNLGCPLIMYSAQVFCFLSVWLTVGFTVERYFAVCSPLERQRVCTVSKAKKVAAGLTGIAVILFSYVLIIARALPKDEVFAIIRDHPDQHGNVTFKEKNNVSPAISEKIESIFWTNNSQEKFTSKDMISLESDEVPAKIMKDQIEYEKRNFLLLDLSAKWILSVRGSHHRERYKRESHHIRTKIQLSIAKGLKPQTSDMMLNTVIETSQGPEIPEDESKNVSSWGTDDKNSSSLMKEDEIHEPLICTVPSKFLTVSIVANYIDSIITLIIPFCLIAYFNIRITICVMRVKDERMKIVATFKTGNTNCSQKESCGSESNVTPCSLNGQSNGDQKGSNFGKTPLKRANGQRRKSTQDYLTNGRYSERESCKRIKWKDSAECPQSKRSLRPISHDSAHNLSLQRSNGGVGLPNEFDQTGFKKNLTLNCGCNTVSCVDKRYVHEDEACLSLNNVTYETVQSYNGLRTMKAIRKESNNTTDDTLSKRKQGSTVDNYSKQNNAPSSEPLSIEIKSTVKRSNSSSAENRVTRILLLVSTVFLVLNLPSHAIRATAFIQNLFWENDIQGQKMIQAAQQFSNILLFNTNFAVNFLLYCVSGRNFRESLKAVLLGTRKRNTRGGASNFNLLSLRGCQNRNLQSSASRSRIESTVVFDDEEVDGENYELRADDHMTQLGVLRD